MSAFSAGIHIVLVAWLAMSVLQLSPAQWGGIQAAAIIPNLLLMIWAGAWADRYNPAKILAGAQLLLFFAYLGLCLAVAGQALSFSGLLLYAIFIGTGNAFVQPVREKLLGDIESETLQKRVSAFSIVQFGLQSGGIVLASFVELFGMATVLGIAALSSLMASAIFASLVGASQQHTAATTTVFDDVKWAALHILNRSGLRQLLVLVAFNGYMHMGVFLVIIPVVATRLYGFSSQAYAILQLLFVLGMVVAHFSLLRAKTLKFPGQGALFSLLYTALIGFGLAKGPTEFGFYCLVFLWGVVAGNSASRCRLVLQLLVAPNVKGKMMAAYQLLLFGAAAFGALVTGIVTSYLSASQIFSFMSISSVVLFVMFLLTREIWGIEQVDTPSS